jgi:hypothetical protein
MCGCALDSTGSGSDQLWNYNTRCRIFGFHRRTTSPAKWPWTFQWRTCTIESIQISLRHEKIDLAPLGPEVAVDRFVPTQGRHKPKRQPRRREISPSPQIKADQLLQRKPSEYSDGLEGRGWTSSRDKRLFSCPRRPDRLWGPHSLLSNGYRGGALCPGVKRPGCGNGHSFPPSAEVKNGGAILRSPIRLHGLVRN